LVVWNFNFRIGRAARVALSAAISVGAVGLNFPALKISIAFVISCCQAAPRYRRSNGNEGANYEKAANQTWCVFVGVRGSDCQRSGMASGLSEPTRQIGVDGGCRVGA
jgi:hypothetical protein